MNVTIKVLIVVFMILYVVSPIDACPGPIDDIIVVVACLIAQNKK